MSSRVIPSDTLIDRGRIYRKRLSHWALSLSDSLSSLSGRYQPDLIGDCTALLNNAALVLSLTGRAESAGRLCKAQCHWLLSLPPLISVDEAGALAVQSLVNAGRLLRQQGKTEAALRQFSSIYVADGDHTLEFFGHHIRQTDRLKRLAEPMYVYEVLKTHLVSRQYASARNFLDEFPLALMSSGAAAMATELEMQLQLLQENYPRCAEVLNSEQWNTSRHSIITKIFYRAVLLQRTDHREMAIANLRRVLSHLGSADIRDVSPRDHNVYRLLFEAASLCSMIDDIPLLQGFVDLGLSYDVIALDVPLAASFAQLVHAHYERPHEVAVHPADVIRAAGYAVLSPKYGARPTLDSEQLALVDRLEHASMAVCRC